MPLETETDAGRDTYEEESAYFRLVLKKFRYDSVPLTPSPPRGEGWGEGVNGNSSDIILLLRENMMLFRLLLLLFLLLSGKVFAREAPIDVFEYVDDVKIVAFIKESDIDK